MISITHGTYLHLSIYRLEESQEHKLDKEQIDLYIYYHQGYSYVKFGPSA